MTLNPQRLSVLSQNLALIQSKIEKSQQIRLENGISSPVRLVAVSKTKPLEDILILHQLGHTIFGENYIQELVEKAEAAPKDIEWHFIGNLQSNKCKMLAKIPNLVVETIDGIKKADAMNKAWNHPNPLRVFIQINTSKEENKGGIDPMDCSQVAMHILQNCPKLHLQGLMTIGAFDRDPTLPNPDFKSLIECTLKLSKELNRDLEMSMGMSGDFEQAIQLGSTNVRVGSSLFGERSYNKA